MTPSTLDATREAKQTRTQKPIKSNSPVHTVRKQQVMQCHALKWDLAPFIREGWGWFLCASFWIALLCDIAAMLFGDTRFLRGFFWFNVELCFLFDVAGRVYLRRRVDWGSFSWTFRLFHEFCDFLGKAVCLRRRAGWWRYNRRRWWRRTWRLSATRSNSPASRTRGTKVNSSPKLWFLGRARL